VVNSGETTPYTSKHVSWLNMVEIELTIFCKPYLDDQISDDETLRQEAQA
jgi:hypothetical protein